MRTIVALWGLLLAIQLEAQTVLYGHIADEESAKNLENVIVTLKNPKGYIVQYTQTDKEGKFALKSPVRELQEYTLHFSLMGYQEKSFAIEGDNRFFEARLRQVPVQISEVLVKSRRLNNRGDTLSYHVAGFATGGDKSIGDVLKRMPGIQIDSEGKIKYNGKDINKFYIEGKDLLEGRYGIATNGISHEDVAWVEVMEKHQPIKVLTDFTFSDQAALNLKLKEGAKAQWIGKMEVAGGYADKKRELWKADLFGMLIKRNSQNITTLKSNNTGENIERGIRNLYSHHASEGNTLGLNEYITIASRRFSGLEEKRQLFNRSHLFSTSQLMNTRRKAQIKVQMDYLNNRITDKSSMTTTYFLPDGNKIITEGEQGDTKQNNLNMQVVTEINKDRSYLKHTLDAVLKWKDIDLQTTGTLPNHQFARKPAHQLGSHLQWMRRFGKHLITFTSNNRLYQLSQRLNVTQGERMLCQSVESKMFYTDEKANYSFALGQLVLSLQGGVNGVVRSLETYLTGVTLPPEKNENKVNTNYVRLYISPRVEYDVAGWNFALNLPTSYYHYRLGTPLYTQNEYLFSPSLNIRWKTTPRLDFQLNGRVSPQAYHLENYYDGIILSDYRSLKKGYGTHHNPDTKSVMGSLIYKHSLAEFFANVHVIHLWNSTPYQKRWSFKGDYLLYSYVPDRVSSRSLMMLGDISKGLDFLKGMVSLNATYTLSDMLLQAEEEPVDYTLSSGRLSLDISGQPCSWFDWLYKVDYGFSCLDSKTSNREVLEQWQHNLSLNFWPLKNSFFKLSGEYYRNEITKGNYKKLLMLDAKFTYRCSDFEVYASANNLFNKREYAYNIHNELTSVSCMQRIRGREFLVGFCWKK